MFSSLITVLSSPQQQSERTMKHGAAPAPAPARLLISTIVKNVDCRAAACLRMTAKIMLKTLVSSFLTVKAKDKWIMQPQVMLTLFQHDNADRIII
ncbi:hypothetical protein FRX31_007733 [Thalictrum thalictroides]|uniref:Uncharacterized protein n=1 Tax=Thalictrum thalictroides TaxID=46969 RepID=A0A7J6X2W6_THATH|nr:hypothetical protein FRX31_007733 [Thalictrum thalictroides]